MSIKNAKNGLDIISGYDRESQLAERQVNGDRLGPSQSFGCVYL